MGIQATVVYDSNRHAPVVVRSSSTTATSTGVLADTIASFSEHVTAMREVAKTPAEVCALWGGPPYITYALVRKRFRVIVIWDEVPGELDVAYDVHYCVSTLQTAVAKHAVPLSEDDSKSIAAVYEAAGHALLGGDDEYVRVEDNNNSHSKNNKLDDDSPLPAPKLIKKKTATGLRKLFGRAKKTDNTNSSSAGIALEKSKSSTTSIYSKTESGVTSITEGTTLDNEPTMLNLPPEVFNWADFGKHLPPAAAGDISWIAELLRGDEHRAVIAAPVIRKNTADSTNSNVTPSVSSIPSAQPMSPPPILPPAVSSTESKPIPTPSSTSTPKVSVSSSSSKPPVPQQLQKLSQPTSPPPPVVTPLSAASVSSNSAVPMPAVPVQNPGVRAVPVSAQPPPVLVNSPQLHQQSVQPSPPVQKQPTPTQEARIVQPQGDRIHTEQVPVQQKPAYSNGHTQSQNPIATATPIQNQATAPPSGFRGRGDTGDDFDVSALGGIKGSANGNTISSSNAGTAAADPIRGMMNTFAKTMQSGDFPGALNQVYATLRALATLTPRRKKETLTCSNYVLALKIMQRVRGAGITAVEAALLTMFLAELKHLLPMHRTAAMRMAIDKNLAVGNFGMAARWMRQLNNNNTYATKLQLCIQRGEHNAHMPPTNKLCYNLLTILTPPYGKCTECTAVYKPALSGVQIGQKCPTCLLGTVAIAQ